MGFHYFWINGAVREVDAPELVTFISDGDGAEKLCVDDGAAKPETTYGFYYEKGGWTHVPYDQFPAEFKTHLLLLGIRP